LPARVHDLLDDGEQVKGRAGKLVDPRHRHHVAGGSRLSAASTVRASRVARRTFFTEILAPTSALMVNRRRLEIKYSQFLGVGYRPSQLRQRAECAALLPDSAPPNF
jgi:hypothetical protein